MEVCNCWRLHQRNEHLSSTKQINEGKINGYNIFNLSGDYRFGNWRVFWH